jgi:hypothetical protein
MFRLLALAAIVLLAMQCGCVDDVASLGSGRDAGDDARAELDGYHRPDVADAGAGDACEVLPAIECTGVQGACPAGAQVVKEHACQEPPGQSITHALCCPLDQCIRECPACVGC